jgi:thioredoxin-related protein
MSVPDSTGFEKEDLKKHRPVLVFLFDPECDHCHQATKELLANIAAFKKAQVVMASSQDFKLLKDFYAEFDIAAYPNIKMGRDAGYFLGTFFGISSYPAIFLYDKKGKFIRAYRPGESFEGIAADLFK